MMTAILINLAINIAVYAILLRHASKMRKLGHRLGVLEAFVVMRARGTKRQRQAEADCPDAAAIIRDVESKAYVEFTAGKDMVAPREGM